MFDHTQVCAVIISSGMSSHQLQDGDFSSLGCSWTVYRYFFYHIMAMQPLSLLDMNLKFWKTWYLNLFNVLVSKKKKKSTSINISCIGCFNILFFNPLIQWIPFKDSVNVILHSFENWAQWCTPIIHASGRGGRRVRSSRSHLAICQV